MLIATMTNVNISRVAYGQNIFDIGAFVIQGVFTVFNITSVVLTNLRMGKRSMIIFDSTSYYSITAPCIINIHDVIMYQ